MGRIKDKLTDYKNFWLIWISAAGQKEGISIFKIQTTWDIKTNYLYHNEASLGKPLFKLMEEQRYIDIVSKKIKPRFEWIPEYVYGIFQTEKTVGGFWSPQLVLKERWKYVQPFMEAYRKHLFDLSNLRKLYRDDRDALGIYGRYIFLHVFLYVIFSNIIAFSKKYSAEIVSKMIATTLSLGTGADLLNYMYELHSTIGGSPDFPLLFQNEQELTKLLCNLKW
jgi:hypothetical protein